jgi:hypothetical protein
MITIESYATIARLREKLHLALRVPDIYHVRGCLNHQACFEAWQLTWLGTVGHKLLHPDELFQPSISDIKVYADNILVLEMNQSCLKSVVSLL